MRHRLIASAALATLVAGLAAGGAVRSSFTATTGARSAFAAAALFAPRALEPPVVTGVARQGETLRAELGTLLARLRATA